MGRKKHDILKSSKSIFQILFIISVTAVLILFYYNKWYLFFSPDNIAELKVLFMQFGIIFPIIIICIVLLFSVFFLPTIIFAVLFGYIYDPIKAIFFSWFAISLGIIISFFLSRYLFQGSFLQKFGSKKTVQRFEKYLVGNQFLTIFILRLIMIIPYNVMNYAFGLTKINGKVFIVASMLGILPVTILNVRVGSLLSIAGSENVSSEVLKKNGLVTIGLALFLIIAVVIIKKIFLKREKDTD
ncbi:MAG: VTT domain-containing protein [Spirochaetaceae bacterium]|nr:VTT domain-containing protein [Spirochaetaceae bacterium]